METILFLMATIFGTVSGVANFPQAYKIFKRKGAGDISIITYSFLLAGAIVWILYGIELGNFPITIKNIIGGFNIALVVVGWALYGRQGKYSKL